MTSLVALFALPATTYPVFIVQQRVDAIDVWAPGAASATGFAALWTTNAAGPSEEFPFDGETDTQRMGAHRYPESTRPYVRLTDRRTVGGCWYATATPPRHSAAFRVPTYAEWRATVARNPGASSDTAMHTGVNVDLDVRSVALDAPGFRTTWDPYRRYIVVESAHVWYYPAASAADALHQARVQWIDGGVYALGRRLRSSEAADLTGPARAKEPPAIAALRKKLPVRPWRALMASRCEPLRVRDRIPGSYETVTTALPAQRAPFDARVIGAGGVPYFSNGL